MENVEIKGRGGNEVQHKNWKGKILRIWITIIRHGGLGHEVQDSWPYLTNATSWPYELSHMKNEFSLVGLTAYQLIRNSLLQPHFYAGILVQEIKYALFGIMGRSRKGPSPILSTMS